MERNANRSTVTGSDARHDQLWQRVSPTLDPYPDLNKAAVSAMAPMPDDAQTPEIELPGAEANPCCMGSAAMDDIDVITGFIEAAYTSKRYYLAFMCQSPSWARNIFRNMAREHEAVAKRLMAVYYLITGSCYRPSCENGKIWIGPWCSALRERYHIEACAGLNYIRAAEGTTDPCLAKLMTTFSEDAYRRADRILSMLERTV